MRRLTLCVVLALLVGASGCRQPDTTPETKITTKDGKVSAVFPHQPTETKDGDDLMYACESRDGKTAYLLTQSYFDEELDLDDKAFVQQKFEAMRDSAVEGKEKILRERAIDRGRFPGYTFDAEATGDIYRARIYFTEKYFVQIVVLGSKRFVDSPEATKFLDSLVFEE